MCALKTALEWWSVLGLALDLIGFLMIVLEWRQAWFEDGYVQDRFEYALREAVRYQSDEGLSAWQEELERYGKSRPLIFWFGVVFISLGFALQMIGNWPCRL